MSWYDTWNQDSGIFFEIFSQFLIPKFFGGNFKVCRRAEVWKFALKTENTIQILILIIAFPIQLS